MDIGSDSTERINPPPPPPPAQGYKQDIFTLTEGDVVLRWPENLAADSYQDLEDWLGLMLRKIARATGATPRAAAPRRKTASLRPEEMVNPEDVEAE